MTENKKSYEIIRNKLEDSFEILGRLLYKNPIKTLIVIFLITGTVSYLISHLTMDTSAEGMLYKDDPIRIAYNQFRDQFGSDANIIIAVHPPEVFNENFLKKLKSFHSDLKKEIPYVKEINSLINARCTRGEGDVLIIEKLLSQWPANSTDLGLLKEKVMNNPLFINNFISEDGRVTALIIELAAKAGKKEENKNKTSVEPSYISAKENTEIVKILTKLVEQYQGDDFQIFYSGGPVVEDRFNYYTMIDTFLQMIPCSLVIIIFPWFLFRRFSGVILPYTVIMPALFCVFGLMALFNIPFSLISGTLPPFVIAVGTGDSIHFLTIFYRNFDKGKSKEDAVAIALKHTGSAIVLTSLTTAAGLLSFSFAELASIAHFGIFAAVGVILALLFTIFMLPPLLALFPLKIKADEKKESNFLDGPLLFFAKLSTGHPVKIIIIAILIFIISCVMLLDVRFSHFPLSWFPDDTTVVKDTFFIDDKLKGTVPLEIIIDTKKEGGVYNPELLNSIEKFSNEIRKNDNPDIYIGKVFSINDIIKEINSALHGSDPNYYTIPQDSKAVAQQFLLFEMNGSDDLERVVDSTFSKTRITIKTTWVDAVVFDKYIIDLNKRLKEFFPNEVDITVTGLMSLIARTFPATLNSMTKSYVIAFIAISIMMVFLVGDSKIGLLAMFPNLLPIAIVMGIMTFFKFPLDMNTIMIGSIALGVVVDDTVHYIYNFRKYYEQTGDAIYSVTETFLGCGRAMLITTLILSCVYAGCLLWNMQNVKRFGGFVSLVIFLALLSDFIVLPAILVLISKTKNKLGQQNYKSLNIKDGDFAN